MRGLRASDILWASMYNIKAILGQTVKIIRLYDIANRLKPVFITRSASGLTELEMSVSNHAIINCEKQERDGEKENWNRS